MALGPAEAGRDPVAMRFVKAREADGWTDARIARALGLGNRNYMIRIRKTVGYQKAATPERGTAERMDTKFYPPFEGVRSTWFARKQAYAARMDFRQVERDAEKLAQEFEHEAAVEDAIDVLRALKDGEPGAAVDLNEKLPETESQRRAREKEEALAERAKLRRRADYRARELELATRILAEVSRLRDQAERSKPGGLAKYMKRKSLDWVSGVDPCELAARILAPIPKMVSVVTGSRHVLLGRRRSEVAGGERQPVPLDHPEAQLALLVWSPSEAGVYVERIDVYFPHWAERLSVKPISVVEAREIVSKRSAKK